MERVFHGMVGDSAAMRTVHEKIAVYGPAEAPVLVTGETGTGKELVARALHLRSPRRSKPWVALNCSALNEDLFESELFGHERGAFTGAVAIHHGRFERAQGGTLFLDEVGDMPHRVQAKLLRVLEHGLFERVGGEREIESDVRVVAATNVPLERAVAARVFREDLYHRIAVLRIHVPPLRDRLDDLGPLAEHFLRLFNERYGRAIKRLTPEALRLLEEYPWPGNVRELRNVLERVYVEAVSEVIGRNAFAEWERERDLLAAGAWSLDLRDEGRLAKGAFVVDPRGQAGWAEPIGPAQRFPLATVGSAGMRPTVLDLPAHAFRHVSRAPKHLDEKAIREAFASAGGVASRAAEILGCHKTTLYRNMKRLGLSREDLETAQLPAE